MRILEYVVGVGRDQHSHEGIAAATRVELYRLLADEARLRLLALCAEEELSVNELAELLGESQPQVSKKASPLRKAGLLLARKEGSRTLLRFTKSEDAVVQDALAEGRRLGEHDGSLSRVPLLVARREEAGRLFFDAQAAGAHDDKALLSTLRTSDDPARGAHIFALSSLFPARSLVIDVGCGDGLFLDVLSAAFTRVLAVDRSEARLARCSARVAQLGLPNVSLLRGSWDDVELMRRTDALGGADLVFAGRVLHHAARPKDAVAEMARLLRPGGTLLVLDYLAHHDDSMRSQGDVWLGFESGELQSILEAAGLEASTAPVPAAVLARQQGFSTGDADADVADLDLHAPPDLHLPWQVAVGKKPPPVHR